jgi:hypothetical protein
MPKVQTRAASSYVINRSTEVAERRWAARKARDNREQLARYVRAGVVRGLAARPEALKARDLGLKAEVFSAYGAMCHCCGEGELAFLTLDDPLNIREIIDGPGLWSTLKKQGYPDQFVAVCFNCQVAGLTLEGCPHKREVATELI